MSIPGGYIIPELDVPVDTGEDIEALCAEMRLSVKALVILSIYEYGQQRKERKERKKMGTFNQTNQQVGTQVNVGKTASSFSSAMRTRIEAMAENWGLTEEQVIERAVKHLYYDLVNDIPIKTVE